MINVLELFGGIRSIYKAFLNLKINVNTLDYIENDEKVVNIANAIFGTNYKAKSVVNYHYKGLELVDLLIGGSPCQDFSLAGLNAGGEKGSNTRSSLIWEQLRIFKETMPKYYIWENVKNVLSKKHINVFNKHNNFIISLGYKIYYKILNAKDFGIPQHRERVFLIAIRNDLNEEFNFDNLEKKELQPLSNFLEKNVDKSYFIKGNYLEKNKDNEFIKMSDGSVRPTFKISPNGIITVPLSKNFTSNKISTGRGVVQTITTSGNNKILEYTNFITIPKATDKKLINGSYNRVWKDKYVETINSTNISKILDSYKTKTGIDKVNIYNVNSENYIYNQNTNKSINTIPSSGRTAKIIEKTNYKDLLFIKWNNQLWNVRTLIELECFRLMAFDDEDFYKAKQVATKQQLYKVAGNAIVVTKLEAIIIELLKLN